MKIYLLIIVSFFTFTYAQTYCAGDQISSSDLNTQYEVCYGSGDYETGDSWSLADYDGSQNGGNYHVIFMDMSATW